MDIENAFIKLLGEVEKVNLRIVAAERQQTKLFEKLNTQDILLNDMYHKIVKLNQKIERHEEFEFAHKI